jgi:BirA family transcriptional regulator, biotin operon repressor / biotin---[acetyl-CoA-carboxylase] ligase
MQLSVSLESKGLDVVELQRQLKTQIFGIGEKLHFLPTVDSTNSLAMKLANEGSEEGVVVLTDSQTAGKGRLGRKWVDVAGCNVLSSTLLRPHFPPHFLIMVASLAIVDAIIETCAITAKIKWPNDVLIGDRKVAGILIETSHIQCGTAEQDRSRQLVAILGIGVNVNGRILDMPLEETFEDSLSIERQSQRGSLHQSSHLQQASLSSTATTLESECGHGVSREAFIAHLLQHVEADYLALQQEARGELSTAGNGHSPASYAIWERWRGQLSTLGRSIQVRQGNTMISGVAEDVNEDGELLLRTHSGELVNITWGDVGYPTG